MPNPVILPRLQTEVDEARRALAAAQFERANYVRHQVCTPSELSMRGAMAWSVHDNANLAAEPAVQLSGDPATIAALDLRVTQAQATLAAAQAALAAALA